MSNSTRLRPDHAETTKSVEPQRDFSGRHLCTKVESCQCVEHLHRKHAVECLLAIFLFCFGLTGCRNVEPQGSSSGITTTNAVARAWAPETNSIIVPFPSTVDPLFSKYDQAIIDAVQKRWRDSLSGLNPKIGIGDEKIVVAFKLHADGNISDLKTLSRWSDGLSVACQKAVSDSAPFPEWPDAMRAAVGKDYREVSFTFRHSPSDQSR